MRDAAHYDAFFTESRFRIDWPVISERGAVITITEMPTEEATTKRLRRAFVLSLYLSEPGQSNRTR